MTWNIYLLAGKTPIHLASCPSWKAAMDFIDERGESQHCDFFSDCGFDLASIHTLKDGSKYIVD